MFQPNPSKQLKERSEEALLKEGPGVQRLHGQSNYLLGIIKSNRNTQFRLHFGKYARAERRRSS